MKKELIDESGKSYIFNDAYFNLMTFINNKKTDKNKIQKEAINLILENLSFFMKLYHLILILQNIYQ